MKTLRSIIFLLLSAIFSLISPAFAQRNFQTPAPYSPQLTNELKQIREASLKSDYAWKACYLTNNIGPRPAGSVQATFAAQYVAEELRKLGMDVRLEKVTVPHWVRVKRPGR